MNNVLGNNVMMCALDFCIKLNFIYKFLNWGLNSIYIKFNLKYIYRLIKERLAIGIVGSPRWITRVEKALNQKQFSLCVEAAFDNTSFLSIEKGANEHIVQPALTRWINAKSETLMFWYQYNTTRLSRKVAILVVDEHRMGTYKITSWW